MLVKDETRRLMLQGVADWLETAGLVSRLYINDVRESDIVELRSLQEATFAGYAPIPLNGGWHDPQQDMDGLWYLETDPIIHATVIDVPEQTVFGAYVTDAGNATLRLYQRFATSVTIVSQGDYVAYKWTIRERVCLQDDACATDG